MIIAAAVKYGDFITFLPRPARHHDVLRALYAQMMPTAERNHESYECEVQGFMTDAGTFLDRRQALLWAREYGQTLRRQPGVGYQGDELFSEDLW